MTDIRRCGAWVHAEHPLKGRAMNNIGIARTVRRILLELTVFRPRGSAPERAGNGPSGRGKGMPSAGPVAAAAAGAAWLWMVSPALAVSLGDMADEAADDLETVPGLIAIAFYIIGAAIVGFGLLKLKRHVDHPQQTTIGSGLIAILIGVALIAAPAVINALGATFGVDAGNQTVLKPRL